MASVAKAFPGTTMWVSEDLIGAKAMMPSGVQLAGWAQCRGIVCDEVAVKDGMNHDCIKRWTSNSHVDVEGMRLVLSQTIFATTNGLGFMERSSMTNSIGRRLVIYSMSKSFSQAPGSVPEITQGVSLQLLARALVKFEASAHPPTSIEIAMVTAFRRSVGFVTGGLVLDPDATPCQCRTAMMVMRVRCGVKADRIVSTFQAMNPALVVMPSKPWETAYIPGIRCRAVGLTDWGRELAAAREARNDRTVDLDEILSLVRRF